jgi:hypothetical protein
MSKMISRLLAAGVVLSVSSACAAASDTSAVKAAVRELFVKANSGADLSGAVEANCSTIDEFAPFSWTTLGGWTGAVGTYYAQNAITDSKTKVTGFRHVNVKDGRAYVVVDVVYTFKQNGKLHREPARDTFTLTHSGPGWKIDSFAWFGRDGVDGGADAQAIGAVVQDLASLKNAPSPDPQAITDEFAPYAWTGASASAEWFAGLQKLIAEEHETDAVITVAAPSELQINGDQAYGAYPAVITVKVNGKMQREKGSFAFALQKTAGTRHIVSWAWATA